MEPFAIFVFCYGICLTAIAAATDEDRKSEADIDKNRWRKEILIEKGVIIHEKRE